MGRLSAKYEVSLATPILVRGDGRPRVYEAKIKSFDVQLTLLPSEGRSKLATERAWTRTVETLTVVVSREEVVGPPPIDRSKGGRDFTKRAAYFRERAAEYKRVAIETLNNLASFLRFELRQPVSRIVSEVTTAFANPTWTGAAGETVESGIHSFVVRAVDGGRGGLGVIKLGRREEKRLEKAIAKATIPDLHDELLSDAQAAAFDGNIRRAVLELAIACEVFAKHTFFGRDGRAGQVFEALEDRGKTNVRVLDLLDAGGVAAFGKSFRDVDSEAFKDLDHLFRARNKVAHRGEAVFRDDQGHLHRVNLQLLTKWWQSLGKLFRWAR